MKVLLSIKPEFADRIFSGEKKFEFRKSTFKRDVTTVVVYVTQPVGMIVGEFKIGGILEGSPQELWERTKEQAGISWDKFLAYFSGKANGYAIQVEKPERYGEAINPAALESFTAPQSFRYLES